MKLWIARDRSGFVRLYIQKPTLQKSITCDFFDWRGDEFLGYLDKDIFPEVSFENSPQEVEIKLGKE